MERKAILSPPSYDLRSILDCDLSQPFVASHCIQKLWAAIDDVPRKAEYYYYRPDSVLLEPEITLRDLNMFDTSMGNGWAASLGYSVGLPLFFRGRRAAHRIGHARAIVMFEQVVAALKRHGIPELKTFAGDPIYGSCDDWNLEALEQDDWDVLESLAEEFGYEGRDLDSEWWGIWRSYWDRNKTLEVDNPPLDFVLCQYMLAHQDILSCRRSGEPGL